MSDTATTSTKTSKQLAPGDRVLLHGDGPGRPLTVTRIMPNIIICGVRRFDRGDGRALGTRGRIVPATPEAVAAAEQAQQAEERQPADIKAKAAPAIELARQIVATPAEDLAKLGEKRLRQIVAWLDQ